MKKILLLFFVPIIVMAQGYTSYFKGNITNITTQTTEGI